MKTPIGSIAGFVVLVLAQAAASDSFAAPGAPGIPHRWAPPLKQAIGTTFEPSGAESPVWFTVSQGILTEVYYPTIDTPQVGDLQFLITDGKSFFSEQKRDTVSSVHFGPTAENPATVRISGRDRAGHYKFEQEVITHPAAPVVRIRTKLQWLKPGLRVFVLFKPAINNSGSHNTGYARADALTATNPDTEGKPGPVFSALLSSLPYLKTSAGYVGSSDGWQDVSRHFQLTETWPEAGPGNIALIAELQVPQGDSVTYELALGFGATENESVENSRNALSTSFSAARKTYDEGWTNYLKTLDLSEPGKKKFFRSNAFARRSAMVIKMHEDKRHRGAIIASMAKPAIPDSENAVDGGGGYHVVWTRDLYHATQGLLAAGDFSTPIASLRFVTQRQRPDGSWPQNFWINGSASWESLQMDEVAFPILLAAQLVKLKVHTLTSNELEMVRKAAEFIIARGPTTPQDRWEELGGYTPATIAAEIAGLYAAAQLTGNEKFRQTAELWNSKLEEWVLVKNGPLGKDYFLRISPDGHPNEEEWINIPNGTGRMRASEVLDGGFLDLVRFGIRGSHDSRILNTLNLLESPQLDIAATRPTLGSALLYRRYNRDKYGSRGVGGYWPLLAGERGHYAIACGDFERARSQLRALESSALPSGLIPEQTELDQTAGLGVASPLVWAHAEDLVLQRSIEEGFVFDAP